MKTRLLLSATCAIAVMGSMSLGAASLTPAMAQSTMSPPAASGTGAMKPMTPMKHHKMWMAKNGKPKDVTGPSSADHSADSLNGKELTSPMSTTPAS